MEIKIYKDSMMGKKLMQTIVCSTKEELTNILKALKLVQNGDKLYKMEVTN